MRIFLTVILSVFLSGIYFLCFSEGKNQKLIFDHYEQKVKEAKGFSKINYRIIELKNKMYKETGAELSTNDRKDLFVATWNVGLFGVKDYGGKNLHEKLTTDLAKLNTIQKLILEQPKTASYHSLILDQIENDIEKHLVEHKRWKTKSQMVLISIFIIFSLCIIWVKREWAK